MGLVRCLSLLVLPVVFGSQQYGSPVGTVAGIVTEAGSAVPISQVAVTIDGTSLGSLTNQDGEFLILGVPRRCASGVFRTRLLPRCCRSDGVG